MKPTKWVHNALGFSKRRGTFHELTVYDESSASPKTRWRWDIRDCRNDWLTRGYAATKAQAMKDGTAALIAAEEGRCRDE